MGGGYSDRLKDCYKIDRMGGGYSDRLKDSYKIDRIETENKSW